MTEDNTRNKKNLVIPILLAGGSGIRLWPLSQKKIPKSLLKLDGKKTLLQTVLAQIKSIPFASTPLIVSSREYSTLTASHLKKIRAKATVLLETQPHNTATAVAIAAQYALTLAEDPLLLILPVDYKISDPVKFTKMLTAAIKIAVKKKLVIFGVKPHAAITDFGYIKKGIKLPRSKGYQVKAFKEKPNSKQATAYFKSKSYYWNSGIFLFSAKTFLSELALHSPNIFSASTKMVTTRKYVGKNILFNTHQKKGYPNISVDKAVFEKTKHAVVFPFQGNWQDVGNWNSLYAGSSKDKSGNVTSKNCLTFNSNNNFIHSTHPFIMTSGVNDLIIVATKDAILVANRNYMSDFKKIVESLKTQK